MAIAALGVELQRLRNAAREPLLTGMRLVWWRERLTSLSSGPLPAHPVLEALHDAGISLAALPAVDSETAAQRETVLFALASDRPADDALCVAAGAAYARARSGAETWRESKTEVRQLWKRAGRPAPFAFLPLAACKALHLSARQRQAGRDLPPPLVTARIDAAILLANLLRRI